MLADWHICPPVPRTDANLLADVINTVDGASRVTSGNDQGLGSALDGIFDKLADKRLPFAFDLANVELTIFDKLVNELRVANCTNDDLGVASIGF